MIDGASSVQGDAVQIYSQTQSLLFNCSIYFYNVW